MNNSPGIDSIDQIIGYLKDKKLAHLETQNEKINSNTIRINEKNLVHFGSCSYLGLEFNESLKKGSQEAVENYGTQFSSSRAYVSMSLYSELEASLTEIFGGYPVVMPTTTLGHIATIPVLIGKSDAVILDHQVHNSVQTAVKLVKAEGTRVELLRHNRMDLLELRIQELSKSNDEVWYMADGIYSMYGDKAPIHELEVLLNKYPKFHLYIDDAHAMSCFGDKGEGFVLSEINLHERMVVGTSLNKAFAAGGGVIVFPSKELAQKVRNCGGPLITSGPMQPGALGAAIASAQLHLNGELKKFQLRLKENILYAHFLLEKYGLPNLAEKDSPIFFVGVGLPKVGYSLIDKMLENGFMLNIGIFPAVPIKNTGVRFTITRLHTFEQIENMVATLAFNFSKALDEEQYSLKEIHKAFKITSPEEEKIENEIKRIVSPSHLKLEIYNTLIDVDKNEWDSTVGRYGMIDWNGLNVLENSFKNNQNREDNWDFNYIIVRDDKGDVVLSTFTTAGIMKDDMLSNAEISKEIEVLRGNDKLYYTSKFLSVGSLVTEGDHLYWNEEHPGAKESLSLFFDALQELQELYGVTSTLIRDLPSNSVEMDDIMVDNGFFKMDMPLNYRLDISNWTDELGFIDILSKRSKKHFKQNVRRFVDSFEVDHSKNLTNIELESVYKLYLNVQQKGLDINTFPLPFELFKEIAKNENWEIIRLNLIPSEKNRLSEKKTVGVVFAYRGKTAFVGGMVGLDYQYNREFGVYRQAIYQFVSRSKFLGYKTLDFGFCAGIEKKKFGAVGYESCVYMQVKDNFKFESLLAGSFRKEGRSESPQFI